MKKCSDWSEIIPAAEPKRVSPDRHKLRLVRDFSPVNTNYFQTCLWLNKVHASRVHMFTCSRVHMFTCSQFTCEHVHMFTCSHVHTIMLIMLYAGKCSQEVSYRSHVNIQTISYFLCLSNFLPVSCKQALVSKLMSAPGCLIEELRYTNCMYGILYV